MASYSVDAESILTTRPLLLDKVNSRFPEDIVIKINNIICDERIKQIYARLESNFIRNTMCMFLNDKKLSKFLYYYGYQTYYFHYILSPNLGIYGETLNKLDWGDFDNCEMGNYNGVIPIDNREPYLLNIPTDEVFGQNANPDNIEFDFYKYDVNIYSANLTLNETLWILKNYAYYDSNILRDMDMESEYEDSGREDIAKYAINHEDTYDNIYDYDNEEFAIIWNLFNRGFARFNIFKLIYILCYNTDIDNTVQKYYNVIGGTGRVNGINEINEIKVDNAKLFHKTCYNVIKYFNKKIKRAAEDQLVISYLYAIYADDDGVYFNEEHEEHENKAYDILNENGLLKTKQGNMHDILDLLYVLYLK
jgi:hypothetical protein